jgi:hypothetical protein
LVRSGGCAGQVDLAQDEVRDRGDRAAVRSQVADEPAQLVQIPARDLHDEVDVAEDVPRRRDGDGRTEEAFEPGRVPPGEPDEYQCLQGAFGGPWVIRGHELKPCVRSPVSQGGYTG